MIVAGEYQTLRIGRIAEPGIYLTDEQEQEVLLPNRYVRLEDKVGNLVDVFVYHDSENRLIATREKPHATVGEAAVLKAVDRNAHGVFLDWGITAKDLFLPNRNVPFEVEIGRKYLVWLYRDNLTGRVVATTKLNPYVNNTDITVRHKEQVDILVARRMEAGYRVVVNNRHWGMIYRNQLFRRVEIGDRLKGYVSRITDDNRIDISLQQQGYRQVQDSAATLRELLTANGGFLPLNDNSDPQEVARMTQMSKKVFKRSVGMLLKSREVEMTDEGIKLVH